MTMSGLDKWYGYMKSHDTAALWTCFTPMRCSKAPSSTRRSAGATSPSNIWRAPRRCLGGPGFKYIGEWRSANGAVLEFENEIEGIKINGVDIITFSDDGKITHFKVMVRPLKGINLLHRLMGEQLAKQ